MEMELLPSVRESDNWDMLVDAGNDIGFHLFASLCVCKDLDMCENYRSSIPGQYLDKGI